MPQKVVRARVREDRRLLELPEAVPEAAGGEVYVTLTGLPDEPVGPRPAPPRTPVLPGTRLIAPPLTREQIYEDAG